MPTLAPATNLVKSGLLILPKLFHHCGVGVGEQTVSPGQAQAIRTSVAESQEEAEKTKSPGAYSS